jgi:hypothetical protein
MTVFIALALFALFLQAAQHSVSYDTALWLAGVLTPGVSQIIKKRGDVDGPDARNGDLHGRDGQGGPARARLERVRDAVSAVVEPRQFRIR